MNFLLKFCSSLDSSAFVFLGQIFHHVAQAVLEHMMSQLNLITSGITDVHYYDWLSLDPFSYLWAPWDFPRKAWKLAISWQIQQRGFKTACTIFTCAHSEEITQTVTLARRACNSIYSSYMSFERIQLHLYVRKITCRNEIISKLE